MSHATFTLVFQEYITVPRSSNAGETHTLAREDPDHERYGTQTRTDARENGDNDVHLHASGHETVTVTKAREHQDTDAFDSGPRAIPSA